VGSVVSAGGGTGEGWMESDGAVVLGASWLSVESPAVLGVAEMTRGNDSGVMPAVAYTARLPGIGSQHTRPNSGKRVRFNSAPDNSKQSPPQPHRVGGWASEHGRT
jgi:hypothetical protein